MFITNVRRFSVDSPFRYGMRKAVASRIYKKDFGMDVLILASTKRLKSEALKILDEPDSSNRGKAYWEILAKRTNESLHLLDFATIHKLLDAFEVRSNRRDLLAGICHMLANAIEQTPSLSTKAPSPGDIVSFSRILSTYGPAISEKLYLKIVEALADVVHMVKTEGEIGEIAEQLKMMSKNRRSPPAAERVLVKRLIRRLNGIRGTQVEEYSLDKLVELTQ